MNRPPAEPEFKPVDASRRVGIPKQFCTSLGWISGDGPGTDIDVFLLMLEPERYQMISGPEVAANPKLEALREQIAEVTGGNQGTVEFRQARSAVLVTTLMKTSLQLSESREWRLLLPKIIANVLQIQPGKSHAVIVPAGRYVEVWSVDKFRSEYNSLSLDDILP